MPLGARTKHLAVAATVLLAAGLCGAWLLRGPAEANTLAASSSDTARLLAAEDTLRMAIRARSEVDASRAAALERAYRRSVPAGHAGSCDAAITAMGQAELEALVAVTDSRDPTSRWSSRRTQLLAGALGAIERARSEPSRAQGGGAEAIAANARRLAELPETRFDFQLVVDEHLPAVANGRAFTPGFMRGVLLAYDREARLVACGARVAGANAEDARERLLPRTGFAPDVPNDDLARAMLADDLVSSTLRGAAGKLVRLLEKAE